MASAVISRWSRRFLLAGLGFLLASQMAAFAGAPRRVEVVLALEGFVLTVVFGKAYSLVPSYFDRTLAAPRAPGLHFPLHVIGVGALAAGSLSASPEFLEPAGAVLWAGGVLVFATVLAATIASNPLGRETGTGEPNRERAGLDRLANPFMPVALLYLLVGAYAQLAGATPLPPLVDGLPVRASHLLAAGFALLLLFGVGYRLLPRFLVSTVPRGLAAVTLPAGALGPALLAVGYPTGDAFVAGAALEALAVAGFAVSYGWLFATTDRDRIGFYGPLFGVLAGLGAVAIGLDFALAGLDPVLARAHFRLNLLGLLGLSILGILYQFYPPAVASWPGAGDRLALGSLVTGFVGVALLGLAPFMDVTVGRVGHLAVALAAALALYCVAGTIRAGTARG